MDYKNWSGPPAFPFFTMYSPHSWLGVVTIAFWGLHVIFSLLAGAMRGSARGELYPGHKFVGKFVYILGLATCALGLQDMQSSDLAASMPMMNMTSYAPSSTFAQLSSAAVLVLALVGVTTLYALSYDPAVHSESAHPRFEPPKSAAADTVAIGETKEMKLEP